MIVYAESSAVATWLFAQPNGDQVRDTLQSADRVVTSRLTLVECERAIERRAYHGALPAPLALAARRMLQEETADWLIMDLVGDVPSRAGRRFPVEPLRTLDALHLASALVFHEALGGVTVLTLDTRLRENAVALGLAITG